MRINRMSTPRGRFGLVWKTACGTRIPFQAAFPGRLPRLSSMPNSAAILVSVCWQTLISDIRRAPRTPCWRINPARYWRSSAENVGGRPLRTFRSICSVLFLTRLVDSAARPGCRPATDRQFAAATAKAHATIRHRPGSFENTSAVPSACRGNRLRRPCSRD